MNGKTINDVDLSNVTGGAQIRTKKSTGNATKICYTCQMRVDAGNTKCPYCGGKLSDK